LISLTNIVFDRATAVGYVMPSWYRSYFVIGIQLFITPLIKFFIKDGD